MKTSRYLGSQIMATLKQSKAKQALRSQTYAMTLHELGQLLQVACEVGGMSASLMKRMKELEGENRRLKKCTWKESSLQRLLGILLKKVVKPAR